MCVCVCVCVLSHFGFCDLMDCSSSGSSVCGISQARILVWVAFPPPGDLPNPRTELASPVSPALAGRFFTTVPPGKPQPQPKCLLLTVTFMVYRVGFNFMFVYLLQNIAWLHFSSFINVSSTGKYESCLLTYKKTFFSKGLQFIFLHQ